MIKYIVKEENSKVVVDQVARDERDPRKFRKYDFLDLEATMASQRITITKGQKIIVNKILYTEIGGADGLVLGDTASESLSNLQKILKGRRARTYDMSNYLTNTTFSGDVDYIEFPDSPYGDIIDNLEKEFVCFGDSSDTTRGTSNTLELRGLSSGTEVKYEIIVAYNVDAESTFTLSSPSGQFASSTFSTTTLNSNAEYIMTGTSSVTNTHEWKLYGSIDSDGGGTYRISRVKITITR